MDASLPGSVPNPAEAAALGGPAPPAACQLARVRAYYDATVLDYRVLWMNGGNRAMHFGYWDRMTRTHAESLANMNRVLAERLDIRGGERVLDAGCGVGGSSIWLARHLGVTTVGITPVPAQVRRARRYAKQQGMTGHTLFSVADYSSTGFADGSFDVVWALESVCHALDKGAFFQEARRLLRPGGKLGVAEYVRVRRNETREGEAVLHRWVDGWAIPDLATLDELEGLAAGAGFHAIEAVDISANVRRSSRRMYRIAVFLRPLEDAFAVLRLRNARQRAHHVATTVQYEALRRGLWRYVLLTARAGVQDGRATGQGRPATGEGV